MRRSHPSDAWLPSRSCAHSAPGHGCPRLRPRRIATCVSRLNPFDIACLAWGRRPSRREPIRTRTKANWLDRAAHCAQASASDVALAPTTPFFWSVTRSVGAPEGGVEAPRQANAHHSSRRPIVQRAGGGTTESCACARSACARAPVCGRRCGCGCMRASGLFTHALRRGFYCTVRSALQMTGFCPERNRKKCRKLAMGYPRAGRRCGRTKVDKSSGSSAGGHASATGLFPPQASTALCSALPPSALRPGRLAPEDNGGMGGGQLLGPTRPSTFARRRWRMEGRASAGISQPGPARNEMDEVDGSSAAPKAPNYPHHGRRAFSARAPGGQTKPQEAPASVDTVLYCTVRIPQALTVPAGMTGTDAPYGGQGHLGQGVAAD